MARDWPYLPKFQSEDDAFAVTPEGWSVRQIEDIFEKLEIGKRFDQKTSFASGGVPVIDQSADGFVGYHDEEPGVVASKTSPVITFANHTCEMRILRRPFSVIQNVFPMVGKLGVCETLFFYYATKGRVHLEEYKGHYPDFRRLWISLPPLAEQKAIAAVLGALDDKIDLNRRMNATLEAMARALFQSWFVDFDPVRAKLDGRPPVGLDQATATLFPGSFQDSAAGHIPRDWRVGVLDDLTKFVIGGDWGATEPTGDKTVSCYCIRGADIPSLQSGGVGKMPTRFLKPSSVEKRQLADGDLAIEISGGSPTQCTGRPVLASDALLKNLGQPLVASNFCRILKLKSPALSKFVYLWLRRLYDSEELFQFETGTTGIKNFAFVIFSERYPIVVPDIRVAEAFDRAVSPFFARIQVNSEESRTLATLRDTLLPKLLNGELRVNEVKAKVERMI